MARLFDTHAHFDPFAADGSVGAVLDRAAAAGVARMCAVGSSEASNELVVRLAQEHPDVLVAAVGYDRDQLDAPRDLDQLVSKRPARPWWPWARSDWITITRRKRPRPSAPSLARCWNSRSSAAGR